MYKKKIALACAAIATAGLLMTGCSRNWDTELRKKVYEDLQKVPERTYSVKEGDLTIKANATRYYSSINLTIKNDVTGDVQEMCDFGIKWGGCILPDCGYFKGVDEATVNGYSCDVEGLDEKFDKALRIIGPQLENRIAKEIDKAKTNTDLR